MTQTNGKMTMEKEERIGIMITTCGDFSMGVVCGNRYNDGEKDNFFICNKCLKENDLKLDTN